MENLVVKTLDFNDTICKSDSALCRQCPSKCSLCSHYHFQGRQGGNCELLNVTVRGEWNACTLGVPLFIPYWKNSAWVMRSPAPVLN